MSHRGKKTMLPFVPFTPGTLWWLTKNPTKATITLVGGQGEGGARTFLEGRFHSFLYGAYQKREERKKRKTPPRMSR